MKESETLLYWHKKRCTASKNLADTTNLLLYICTFCVFCVLICCTLDQFVLVFHVSLVIPTKWIHLTISTPFLLIKTDLKIDCITFMTVKPMKRIVFIPNAWPISSIILDASRCASFRSMFFSLISYELKSLNI